MNGISDKERTSSVKLRNKSRTSGVNHISPMLTMNVLDAKDNSDLCLFCGCIFLSGTLSQALLMISSMVVIMTLAYVQGQRSKEHQIHPNHND